MNPSPLGNEPPKGDVPKVTKKVTAPDAGPKLGPKDQFLPASYKIEHNGFEMVRSDN